MKTIIQFSLFYLLCALTISPGVCSTSDGSDPKHTSPAHAADRIVALCVEGNNLIPIGEILAQVKTKVGDLFVRERVFDDLKAINELGFFDERSLQVVPTKQREGGIKLSFHVREFPAVTCFSFEGNRLFSTARLSEFFANQVGKPQNLAILSGTIDRVEAAYHDQGYVLARVTDCKDDTDGSVHLKIDEGRIGEVRLNGFDRVEQSVIRKSLNIRRGSIYNDKKLGVAFKDLSRRGRIASLVRGVAPSEETTSLFTLTIERNPPKIGESFKCPNLQQVLKGTLLLKVPVSPVNIIPAQLYPSEMFDRMLHLTPDYSRNN